jgi:nitrate reductase NapE component
MRLHISPLVLTDKLIPVARASVVGRWGFWFLLAQSAGLFSFPVVINTRATDFSFLLWMITVLLRSPFVAAHRPLLWLETRVSARVTFGFPTNAFFGCSTSTDTGPLLIPLVIFTMYMPFLFIVPFSFF